MNVDQRDALQMNQIKPKAKIAKLSIQLVARR